MTDPPKRLKFKFARALAVVLVLGYLSMSRSFAHLGVPPFYVGEVSLAIFLFGYPRAILLPWMQSLVRRGPLSGVAWLLYLFAVYGVLQCVRGIGIGHDVKIALQNVVFHLYPLFFFVGVWIGAGRFDFLKRTIRLLAWWHGLYGFAFVVFLGRLFRPEDLSPDEVDLFGQPYGAAVVLLGLLSFERNLLRMGLPVILNAFVFLGIQVRAAWLGFATCLPLWSYMTGRLAQLAKLVVVVGGMVLLGVITDFSMPSPYSRGGEVSIRSIVGRGLAPVAPELAAEFTQHADSYVGTVSWRTEWWRGIWRMTHVNFLRAAFGPGYGYAIWRLNPLLDPDEPLRTPHSVFMYALGYTGWAGVLLFYALQIALAATLWRVYAKTGQAFGLCYWGMIMVWAHFDNFLETPFGAIPFFLLAGLSAAPLAGGEQAPPDTPRPRSSQVRYRVGLVGGAGQ